MVLTTQPEQNCMQSAEFMKPRKADNRYKPPQCQAELQQEPEMECGQEVP